MKLVMDEKLKHRLIGVAVILSIATIFTPALIKKSNQGLEPKVNVSVQLPPKPARPQIVEKNEQELFETTSTTQVDKVEVDEADHSQELAQADSIDDIKSTESELVIEPTELEMVASTSNTEDDQASIEDTVKLSPHTSQTTTLATAPEFKQEMDSTKPAVSSPAPEAAPSTAAPKARTPKPKAVSKAQTKTSTKAAVATKKTRTPTKTVAQKAKPAVKHTASAKQTSPYAVQLASYTKKDNATALVSLLKNKGYSARLAKTTDHHSTLYKVYVGHLATKMEARKIKQQLAKNINIKGFVVSTGEG